MFLPNFRWLLFFFPYDRSDIKCKEHSLLSNSHRRSKNLESKVLSTGKTTYILFLPVLRLPFSLCFKCLIKLNWNKCPHKYWHKFKHLGFKSHPRLRCNLSKASVSVLLQTCQISWAEHEIHTFLQHHHLLCSQHNSLSPHTHQVTLLEEYKRWTHRVPKRVCFYAMTENIPPTQPHSEKYWRAFSKPVNPADRTSSSLHDFSLLPKCILAISSQDVLGMISMCPFLFPFFST